jgi:hypothetical protein
LTGYGAHQDDMSSLSKLSDRDADAIVGGNAPRGEDELKELALFFREARNVLAEPPTAATAATHLAAIVETARVAGSQSAGRRASVPPKRRKLRPVALPVRLAAAAAGLALVAAFGGAAYAGGLPDPVQGRVAELVGNVGISLPGNHNDVDQRDVGNIDQGNQGETDQTNQGSTGKTDPGNHLLDPLPKTDDRAQPKTDDRAHANTDDGAHTKANDDAPSQPNHGAHTKTDEPAPPPADEGAHTQTDDGAQPKTDDGAHTNTDDGSHPDPDDGAHGTGENG